MNGREVRSNVISSQIELHTLYGGVVPEIWFEKAYRKNQSGNPAALKEADTALEEIDAVGVTYGPDWSERFCWSGRGESDQLCKKYSLDRRASY